jgi:outer membrane protein assembly factor BamD
MKDSVTITSTPVRCLALGILMIAFMSGCTTIQETASDIKKSVSGIFGDSDENLTAEELAMRGMEEFDDGNYKKAIDNFQKLKDLYPFSRYSMLAELKLGDAHYQLQQYEDAVFAYEEFEKLHPRNEAVPYVVYQIGRCHFDRISTPDRDQTAARKALEIFQRLQKQFPNDPYSRRAADHIVACQRSLAGNEFGIGQFYYKSNHYKGALERFRAVVTKYPDVGYHQQALVHIELCEKKLAQEKAQIKSVADAPPGESFPLIPDNS